MYQSTLKNDNLKWRGLLLEIICKKHTDIHTTHQIQQPSLLPTTNDLKTIENFTEIRASEHLLGPEYINKNSLSQWTLNKTV